MANPEPQHAVSEFFRPGTEFPGQSADSRIMVNFASSEGGTDAATLIQPGRRSPTLPPPGPPQQDMLSDKRPGQPVPKLRRKAAENEHAASRFRRRWPAFADSGWNCIAVSYSLWRSWRVEHGKPTAKPAAQESKRDNPHLSPLQWSGCSLWHAVLLPP